MLHPAVRLKILSHIENSDAKIVFIEAIKLLEGALKDECDTIWVTNCPQIRQIERLIICRGLDEESAVLRVNAQSPQANKVAQADVVIDTGGTLAETKAQIEVAWEDLTKSVGQSASLPAKPVSAPKPSEKPAVKKEATTAPDIVVRRARPSDVPSVLLLIHRATDGKLKMKKAELLMSMSERSYFIGQMGSEVVAVMGYIVDSGLAQIDQIFVHPLENAGIIGPPLLAELEKSANQHICEGLFAYPSNDADPVILSMLAKFGLESATLDDIPRAWQAAVKDTQPAGTTFMKKTLRNVRIA
jgi:N-acetylglutamate synthase-like GNAT family acetyltransferase